MDLGAWVATCFSPRHVTRWNVVAQMVWALAGSQRIWVCCIGRTAESVVPHFTVCTTASFALSTADRIILFFIEIAVYFGIKDKNLKVYNDL